MGSTTKALAVMSVLIMLLCSFPVVSDVEVSDAAGDNGGLLLFQVNPQAVDEGVTVKNYSSKTMDLMGYRISDMPEGKKEGSIVFTASLEIPAGGTVTVLKERTDGYFSKNTPSYVYGEAGTKKDGNFGLSNSGDDVYLFDPDGRMLDAVCYGSKTIADTSVWFGPSVSDKKGFCFQRTGDYDSDTSDDWFNFIPGQTNLPLELEKFDAVVTPFIFPDSGGIPVLQALEHAQESVYIQMYELRSHNVYALLADLENRGVEVTVLHEGMPVGNTVPEMASDMRYLVDNGGDVRFIGGTDNNRFDKMHAKFCIIDGEKVVVTSENWSNGNINGKLDDNVYNSHQGNRGWGAVVESRDYALYMMDVFMNDYSKEYGDTVDFLDRYPGSVPSSPTYTAPMEAHFESYSATVTPVLSNDNSYEATKYFIENAKTRVYSQQQNLTEPYTKTDNPISPIYMMNQRGLAGADAKFILGGYGDKGMEEASKLVHEINLVNVHMSAAAMADPYVHNKGLICDDAVWISSINWTEASMNMNRECCVVIHSEEVSDIFAKCFLEDFQRNYDYGGFKVDTSAIQDTYESGEEVVFEVSVIPEGEYTYVWDFGDGGTRETTIPKVIYSPADGAHVLRITITDSEGLTQTVEKHYTVFTDETDDPADYSGYIAYLIPVLVILIAVVTAVSKGKKRSKGRSGKKR